MENKNFKDQSVQDDWGYHQDIINFAKENKSLKETNRFQFVLEITEEERKIWAKEVKQEFSLTPALILAWKRQVVLFWSHKYLTTFRGYFDEEMYEFIKKWFVNKSDDDVWDFNKFIKEANLWLEQPDNWLNFYFPRTGSISSDLKSGERVFGMSRRLVEGIGCKCSINQIKGDLNLEEFESLKIIDFAFNSLTSLKLPLYLGNLTLINITGNNLTNLDFLLKGHYPNLSTFLTANNNHKPYDIVMFKRFVKLEKIYLTYGNFYGSLEAFKEMKNLREIEITGTDIDGGLEFLPASLKFINCRTKNGWFFSKKSVKIAEIMKEYNGDYQAWRKENLTEIIEQNTQIITRIVE